MLYDLHLLLLAWLSASHKHKKEKKNSSQDYTQQHHTYKRQTRRKIHIWIKEEKQFNVG